MQLKSLKSKEGAKFGIGLIASVVMMFTPDQVDTIIEAVLPLVFGVDLFKIEKK